MNRTRLFIIPLLLSFTLSNAKLDKAFEALSIHNYFEAKRIFEKLKDKEKVAASFGLSQMYSIEKNHFHNVDSAEFYINRALFHFEIIDEKEELRLKNWSIDSLQLCRSKMRIGELVYANELDKSNIESLMEFKDRFPNFSVEMAVQSEIHKVAFQKAVNEGSLLALSRFMADFPDAIEKNKAKEIYDRIQFEQQTASGSEKELVKFIRDHPSSPYLSNTQNKLFALYAQIDRPEYFKKFIELYPENPNRDKAIQAMVEFELYDFNIRNLDSLVSRLPELQDHKYVAKYRSHFNQLHEQNVNEEGPYFERYKEGINLIEEEGKFVFMRFDGQKISNIEFDDAFDFKNGLAVVEREGDYGLIDRRGKVILPFIYEEIGEYADSLIMAYDRKSYAFYNRYGELKLDCPFVPVGDFNANRLIVKDAGAYGMIDKKGRLLIEPQYEWLEIPDEKGEQRFKSEGKYGLRNGLDSILFSPEYNFISTSDAGIRLIEKEGKIAYYRDTLMSEWFDAHSRPESFFSEDFVKVLKKGNWGLMNRAFEIVFPFQNDEIVKIGYGKFALRSKNKMRFLDLKNSKRRGRLFDEIRGTRGDLLIARKKDFHILIDENDNVVFEKDSTMIIGLGTYYRIENINGQFGLLNSKGESIADVNHTKIEFMEGLRYKFYEADKRYILDYSKGEKTLLSD
ncbi:MAG: WG repeat-containing protein [Bacteroidota bacterium]